MSYNEIYSDNIRNQSEVCERFQNNYEKSEKFITEAEQNTEETRTHVILNGDPQFSVLEYSNGI